MSSLLKKIPDNNRRDSDASDSSPTQLKNPCPDTVLRRSQSQICPPIISFLPPFLSLLRKFSSSLEEEESFLFSASLPKNSSSTSYSWLEGKISALIRRVSPIIFLSLIYSMMLHGYLTKISLQIEASRVLISLLTSSISTLVSLISFGIQLTPTKFSGLLICSSKALKCAFSRIYITLSLFNS